MMLQAFMSPVSLALFIVGLKAMEGRAHDVVPFFQANYWQVLKASDGCFLHAAGHISAQWLAATIGGMLMTS